jgi:hypothetical protein
MQKLKIITRNKLTQLSGKRHITLTSWNDGYTVVRNEFGKKVCKPPAWRNKREATVTETRLAIYIAKECANAPTGLKSRHENAHC